MNTQLRVVSKSGKLSLANVLLDEEDDFERVLENDVDLSFKSMQQLKDMIQRLNEASKMPILHITGCNQRIMGGELNGFY